MWVERLTLENIKCFEKTTFRFGKRDQPYQWVTILSENGGGKSTILQALGLLLSGPESARTLLPRPEAWLQSDDKKGTITVGIHKDSGDPGQFAGEARTFTAFGYSFFVTGNRPISINNKYYNEPAIVEHSSTHLSWLRQNAYTSDGKGWFAAGYGPFRRLTREDQIIVPSLDRPARYTNFATQFFEGEPLATFERWMVYLEWRIARGGKTAVPESTQRDIAVEAINGLLPAGTRYDRVSDDARVWFDCDGTKVPTSSLSDGYRSVVALAGDLVWRLMAAFPQSENPLAEEGVVLIDELDIHLHPSWQREIAAMLRHHFPNIQFIVATHSPFIAAGAGEDALTLRLQTEEGRAVVEPVPSVAFKSVDDVLRSKAFGLVSTYSPQAQAKINQYDALRRKKHRTPAEEELLGQLSLDMENARPFGGPPAEGSLEARIDKFLEKAIP